jgi:hypothetical protein
MPAASRPSTTGKLSGITSRIMPLRAFQSIGFTPAARTATRTWPGPACGSSMSVTDRTSAGVPAAV